MPTVVSLLHDRLPGRTVRLRLTRSAHVRDLVHEARADIALMLTRPARDSVAIAPIALRWFATDETPREELVLFAEPCAIRHQAVASLGNRRHRIAAECVNHTSVLGAARAGVGMTPLPRIGPPPEGLRQIPGLPSIPDISLYAATSDRVDSRIRAEVLSVLRSAVTDQGR